MDKSIKPNLFIVGAPKCGTTSMHNYLDQHPEIFMSNPKEPRFFCKDFQKEAPINKSESYFPIKNLSEYKNIFKESAKYKIIGESSPHYLSSKVAARNIKNFNSDAKIIIMLRDPVEQMYSWYYQSIQTGIETAMTFKEALGLESEREKGKNIPFGRRYLSSFLYTDLANYYPQIKRFKENFPPEQIKVILLDDLKSNPEKTYKQILDFLGVEDKNFTPEFKIVNKGTVPRSMLINNKLKNPGKNIKKAINTIFPKKLIHFVIGLIDKANLVEKKKPDLPDTLRLRLMKKHKENVEKTASLIGRDLVSLWDYDEA